MKNVFRIALVLMLVCATIFTMIGCEKKEEPTTDTIVGYWEYDLLGIEFIYTFNEDGTGSYYAAGIDMPFTYKTEGKNLSITFMGDTESFDTQYELKDGKLNVLDSNGEDTIYERIYELPKEAQTGTAGSNMPLKDRADDAKAEIEKAFQAWIAETYGEKVVESKVYVEKMYTAEEEQEVEAIKEMNLGAEEIAFEVRYELKPAEGADINELTVANGVYDEESGWIKEKFNLGVLRPSIEGEALYRVTNIGTGW